MKGSFTKFKQFFIENKFVLGLLIFLLVALDIYVLTKIAFIFDPLMVILKTVLCTNHFSRDILLFI